MNNLPTDILRHICKYFTPKTVGRLLVNKKFASQADLFYESIHTLNDGHKIALLKCRGVVSLTTDNLRCCDLPKLKKLNAPIRVMNSSVRKQIESFKLCEITIGLFRVLLPIFEKIDVIHSYGSSKIINEYSTIAFTSLILDIFDYHKIILNPAKLIKLCLNCYETTECIDFTNLHLQELDISYSRPSHKETREIDLRLFAHMPLKLLSIKNAAIIVSELCKLRELKLKRCQVVLPDLDCLTALASLSLNTCDLQGELSNNVTDLTLTNHSVDKFRKLKLRTLKCSFNTIPDDLTAFEDLTDLTLISSGATGELLPLTLTSLKLIDARVTTEGMCRISRMPLRRLTLKNCRIKGQDLHLLTSLNLHTLDISSNQIDIEYLTVLKKMKLAHLTLPSYGELEWLSLCSHTR